FGFKISRFWQDDMFDLPYRISWGRISLRINRFRRDFKFSKPAGVFIFEGAKPIFGILKFQNT
ncbi:hypothetical protein, partial [uncultured Campylobacter sp.]|uniref:hypothetical protein n=1 Tax=uncultured Campylobacter sp. TaxID=218934 RepID=UPI002607301A